MVNTSFEEKEQRKKCTITEGYGYLIIGKSILGGARRGVCVYLGG